MNSIFLFLQDRRILRKATCHRDFIKQRKSLFKGNKNNGCSRLIKSVGRHFCWERGSKIKLHTMWSVLISKMHIVHMCYRLRKCTKWLVAQERAILWPLIWRDLEKFNYGSFILHLSIDDTLIRKTFVLIKLELFIIWITFIL